MANRKRRGEHLAAAAPTTKLKHAAGYLDEMNYLLHGPQVGAGCCL